MRPEIRNRVTMLDSMVTAEVDASTPDRRAWLMIEPDQGESVVLVEVETSDDVEPDAYLAPEDLVEVRRTTFASVDAAVTHLDGRGVDTDTFEAPWDTDNPF
ncbi:hypothetical protein [Nocardioides sp.]|uniref:hypothetical protein n=1 Tax=Nocardioides sp. TaxID=35761 RepID=UPI00271B1AC0|nr:hypothetical protein [Nocardioides sp.]MDO9457161.1 hypothetical protein [Nocardioides sp.]